MGGAQPGERLAQGVDARAPFVAASENEGAQAVDGSWHRPRCDQVELDESEVVETEVGEEPGASQQRVVRPWLRLGGERDVPRRARDAEALGRVPAVEILGVGDPQALPQGPRPVLVAQPGVRDGGPVPPAARGARAGVERLDLTPGTDRPGVVAALELTPTETPEHLGSRRVLGVDLLEIAQDLDRLGEVLVR
ncbi:MAG: hypothetical protein R2991_01360 [Thermoanaerobaculia bacterium]